MRGPRPRGAWGGEPADGASLAIDIHDREDPDASDPVDADSEAASLSVWAKEVLNLSVAADQIRPLLAEDGVQEPEDDFVEETVLRLIRLLELPVPDDLSARP